jgi:hypothetical protein
VAATKAYLTTREVAEHCGIPAWLARRIVDGLGEDVPRIGLYRLVPAGLLPQVEEQVAKRAREKEAPLVP